MFYYFEASVYAIAFYYAVVTIPRGFADDPNEPQLLVVPMWILGTGLYGWMLILFSREMLAVHGLGWSVLIFSIGTALALPASFIARRSLAPRVPNEGAENAH